MFLLRLNDSVGELDIMKNIISKMILYLSLSIITQIGGDTE